MRASAWFGLADGWLSSASSGVAWSIATAVGWVALLAPMREDSTMGILEAHCLKCGEVFNPADEDDTIHIAREDGTECGGVGVIDGEWRINRN